MVRDVSAIEKPPLVRETPVGLIEGRKTPDEFDVDRSGDGNRYEGPSDLRDERREFIVELERHRLAT